MTRKRSRPGAMKGVLVGALLARCSTGYTYSSRGFSMNAFQAQLAQQPPSAERQGDKTSVLEKREVKLPPWISRHDAAEHSVVEKQVELLEFEMLEQGFSPLDIREVAVTMEKASKGDASVLAGMIEFLQLMLSLEETPIGSHVFVTKDVLIASAIHYVECMDALHTGVYEMVHAAIYQDRSLNLLLPSAAETEFDPVTEYFDTELTRSDSAIVLVEGDDFPSSESSPHCHESPQVSRVVMGAARVKRAEIMAHAVLGSGHAWSNEEASRLRGLLLSVMDDWRSLGIRAVACLYRLEGALKDTEQGTHQYVRSSEVVRAAREAIRVYAPLAQRLGMQRLKAKIEDNAFRVLYRRQYGAASALYKQNGSALKVMSRYLEGQISEMLYENDQLMSIVDDISITARVKEPYSAWTKLIKKRLVTPASLSASSDEKAITLARSVQSDLSLIDVQDIVALRVVLRARKCSPDEPNETTRARERLLCYFVQHLIRSKWPLLGGNRLKDYIQHPKENGYQSLHYNSVISNQGQEWPFEVQVRSEEMHQIAEYGVAAHWDYKLGNENFASLPPAEQQPIKVQIQGEDVLLPIIMPPLEKSYIDALVKSKNELVQNKVFCFFASSSAIANEGKIISLCVGAKVGDALEELHAMLGNNLDVANADHDVKILRNGERANVNDFVCNGDVLLISIDN